MEGLRKEGGLWPGLTCFPTGILIGPRLPCDVHRRLVAGHPMIAMAMAVTARLSAAGGGGSCRCVEGSQDSVGGDEKGQRPQASTATLPCSPEACSPTRVPQIPTLSKRKAISQHVGGSHKVRLEQGPVHAGATTPACMDRHIQASLRAGGHMVASEHSRLTTCIQKRMGIGKMVQCVKQIAIKSEEQSSIP